MGYLLYIGLVNIVPLLIVLRELVDLLERCLEAVWEWLIALPKIVWKLLSWSQ